MKLRRSSIIVLVALGVAFFAANRIATASDADGVRAQATALQGEGYLERVLGADIPRRPLLAGDKGEMDRCGRADGLANAPAGCDGLAYTDAIVIRAGLVGRLARIGDPVNNRGGDAGAAQTLLHEELHSDRDLAPLDEGIVDQIAADETPGFLHYVGAPGPAWGFVPIHYVEALVVRKASARATGTGWTSRAARLWRRALWPLTSAERDALVTEALR